MNVTPKHNGPYPLYGTNARTKSLSLSPAAVDAIERWSLDERRSASKIVTELIEREIARRDRKAKR